MNPYDKNDVELEEIKIKDPSSSNKVQTESPKIIDESQSYTSGSLLSKPQSSQSKYAPTITSVISRKKKKKQGFNEMNDNDIDSDEENDRRERLKRNMSQQQDSRPEEEKPTRVGVGDSEECDDFDWFADDYISNDREKDDEKSDDEDNKESGLTYRFSKIPKAVRYWAWLILGDIIFAVPIILSLVFNCIENSKSKDLIKLENNGECKDWLKNMNIFGHHISKWALWALPTWSVYWLLKIFVHLIPGLVIRIVDFVFGYVPKKIINFADYIRFLQKYVVYAISSFLSYIFLGIFLPTEEGKTDERLDYIYSLVLSIFVSCAIWAVEKIILQSFSISFHKSVYEDRIEEINRAITVLEYLNESRHKNIRSEISPISSKDGLNDNVDKNGLYSKFAKIAKNVVIKNTTKTKSVLLRSSWDAKMLAKNLYYHLGGTDRPQDELTVNNFKEFFMTEQEAQDAFDLFDKDGNGDLSKAEIKSFVLDVYHEQKNFM